MGSAVFSCWFGSMNGEAMRETLPGVLGRDPGFEMLGSVSELPPETRHKTRINSHLLQLVQVLLAAVPTARPAIVHGVQHAIVLGAAEAGVDHLMLGLLLILRAVSAAVGLRRRRDDRAAARRVERDGLFPVDAVARVRVQLPLLLLLVLLVEVATMPLPPIVALHALWLFGDVHGPIVLLPLLLGVRGVGGWIVERPRSLLGLLLAVERVKRRRGRHGCGEACGPRGLSARQRTNDRGCCRDARQVLQSRKRRVHSLDGCYCEMREGEKWERPGCKVSTANGVAVGMLEAGMKVGGRPSGHGSGGVMTRFRAEKNGERASDSLQRTECSSDAIRQQ